MEVASSDSTGRPISELLQECADHHSSEDHDAAFYAHEFATTKYRATHLMRVGKNWAVLQLTDGSVLKLTNIRRLRPEHGQRPFDLPFLQKRQWPLKQARRIIYVTQPRADTPVTAKQFSDFESRLRAFGSRFTDPHPGNLGIHQGRIVLLDPLAVISPRPVSELLREVSSEEEGEWHSADRYAEAFEKTSFRAWRVIAIGGDSVALELADGNVLKITNKTGFRADEGQRPFDLPVLQTGWVRKPEPPQRGHRQGASRGRHPKATPAPQNPGIFFYVQPMVQTPVSREQLKSFYEHVESFGYEMNDAHCDNLGISQGRVVLIDPFAVRLRLRPP